MYRTRKSGLVKNFAEIVKDYNNKVHFSIRIIPTKASKNPDLIAARITKTNFENERVLATEEPKFDLELEYSNGKIDLKKVIKIIGHLKFLKLKRC